jgi:hypothetical protein
MWGCCGVAPQNVILSTKRHPRLSITIGLSAVHYLHAVMSKGKLILNSKAKKMQNVMTGVGLEPTLSFPNQEITIKVTLTWRHNQLGHPALTSFQCLRLLD